jgi:hypothetical protein
MTPDKKRFKLRFVPENVSAGHRRKTALEVVHGIDQTRPRNPHQQRDWSHPLFSIHSQRQVQSHIPGQNALGM